MLGELKDHSYEFKDDFTLDLDAWMLGLIVNIYLTYTYIYTPNWCFNALGICQDEP